MEVVWEDLPPAQRSFADTVGPETRRLYALAFSIVRDRQEADDAVQETMVLAWRNWDQLRDPSRLVPWISRICVNHCIRRRRGLRTRWRTMSRSEAERAERVGEPFTGRMLDLDYAYRKLSVQQRAVVALTYYHGYTVAEAAELMGCAPGTARSHVARALTTLRREIGDVR